MNDKMEKSGGLLSNSGEYAVNTQGIKSCNSTRAV
jgi:hypothetical protein